MLDSFAKIKALCFTQNGALLCEKLGALLPRFSYSRAFGAEKIGREQWTADCFSENTAQKILVVFVGALGIAVRSIAPFVCRKTSDPAVLCIDEAGAFVIPVLSGHIGGANEAAREIARTLSAVPVITTATDIRGVFAVDCWAQEHHLAIENPEAIKAVSAAILSGKKIRIGADTIVLESTALLPSLIAAVGENAAEPPFAKNSAGVFLTISQSHRSSDGSHTLFCVPKMVCVGVGCRRGVSEQKIRDAVLCALKKSDVSPLAIKKMASIVAKKDEVGLLQCARTFGVPFCVFGADELNALSGEFSSSAFVSRTVGTDCVCERAAVAASEHKKLLLKKTIFSDVTVAVAI